MRASPPLLVALMSFRVWRGAVVALCVLALAALVGWAAAAPASRIAVAWPVAVLGGMAIAASAHWLWRVPARPAQLLWDGRCWHLSAWLAGRAGEARAGRLVVAVDLGVWMLLRFTPEPAAPLGFAGRRATWLPVERRAAPFEWHALRYTLYGHAQHAPGRPADHQAGAGP